MTTVLDHYIEQTPAVRGGRPRIADTRITVADVATMYLQLGQSLEEIAGKYNLPLAAVHTAMAYYYDHREEVDGRAAEDAAFAEDFHRNNASPLQAKLHSLRRDEPHSSAS